jgi:cyclophilin family peptidyl-prolyl cis-trans isomerase
MIAAGHTRDGRSYVGSPFHRVVEKFMVQVGRRWGWRLGDDGWFGGPQAAARP